MNFICIVSSYCLVIITYHPAPRVPASVLLNSLLGSFTCLYKCISSWQFSGNVLLSRLQNSGSNDKRQISAWQRWCGEKKGEMRQVTWNMLLFSSSSSFSLTWITKLVGWEFIVRMLKKKSACINMEWSERWKVAFWQAGAQWALGSVIRQFSFMALRILFFLEVQNTLENTANIGLRFHPPHLYKWVGSYYWCCCF